MNAKEQSLLRYGLLKKALNEKASVSMEFLLSCKSQGTLSALTLNNKITPISLNTLKYYAEILPEIGGWKKMDDMRRTCAKIYVVRKDSLDRHIAGFSFKRLSIT
jgi:hypothetical protein